LVGKANKEEMERITRWVAVLCEFVFLEQLSSLVERKIFLEEIGSRKMNFQYWTYRPNIFGIFGI
jgi:hypothetical protein